jgi:YVTN family beta-propeller protein
MLISCASEEEVAGQRIVIQFTDTPNRMLDIGNGEALVSKLYATDIAILDLAKNEVKGTIDLGTETKAMVLDGTTAYVITDSTGYAIINTATKTVTARVTIGDYPASIAIDKSHGQIILLSQGSYYRGTTGKIHFINIATGQVTDSISLASTDYAGSLVDAGSKGFLLFGDRVAVLSYNSNSISEANFIAKAYYGGFYDVETNELILGAAKDYQNPDVVEVYNAATADLKHSFIAGVAAGHFAKYKSGTERKLFILNEGRFGANNASLSSWNYADTVLKNDLAADLGDVGNDVAVMNGKLYLLLNGSKKIVVLDPVSLK